MHLTNEEMMHIYANRNKEKPEKTIVALSELNCCSKLEIHILLDCISESYRYDTKVKKPIIELNSARQTLIENRYDSPLYEKGDLALAWSFYLNDCVKRGKSFEDITTELEEHDKVKSRLELKELERLFSNWKVF